MTDRGGDPRVFLTGFPGFLGSKLVERLLDRGDGPVACLVQPEYRDLARRRATEITGDDDHAGIRLYEGDVTDPALDLDVEDSAFDAVTELYHLAAVYDLAVDPEVGEAVNVRGTEHVLDAAERFDVERFQYVSTCYVSGRYDGVFTGDHLREGQSFNNHYEETKFRAELLVRERMRNGLPATVYRPSIVVGDSTTGETRKYDGPYYLMQLLLAQPSLLSFAPTVVGGADTEFNVVPRDFVVDAIAHLSRREDTVGEVYQLCDPAPLVVPAFTRAVADALDRRVVSVPVPKSLAKWSMARLRDRGMVLEPAAVDYLDHPTRYACPNTERALSGTDLQCPAFESYVEDLAAFVRANPRIGDEAMA